MTNPRTSRWILRITSVLLGFMLWAYISGSRQIKMVTKAFTVPVYFENITDDVILMEDVFYEVNVQLRAPEPVIRKMGPNDLNIAINLENKAFGVHSIPLTEQMVHRPKDAQVVGITPNTIQFRIEKKIRKMLPVKPTIVGDVVQGMEIKKVLAYPAAIALEGPTTEFQKRDFLATEPIDVSGKSASFSTSTFVVLKSDYLKILKDPSVKVDVIIGEETKTHTYRSLPVELVNSKRKIWVNPTTINVIVTGPISYLNQVTRAKLRVFIDCSGLSPREEDYVLTPQIEYKGAVSKKIQDNIQLKTSPEMVNVRVF